MCFPRPGRAFEARWGRDHRERGAVSGWRKRWRHGKVAHERTAHAAIAARPGRTTREKRCACAWSVGLRALSRSVKHTFVVTAGLRSSSPSRLARFAPARARSLPPRRATRAGQPHATDPTTATPHRPRRPPPPVVDSSFVVSSAGERPKTADLVSSSPLGIATCRTPLKHGCATLTATQQMTRRRPW